MNTAALSTAARKLPERREGFLRVRIIRPRAQLMRMSPAQREAWVALTVEVPLDATGAVVRAAIDRRQTIFSFQGEAYVPKTRTFRLSRDARSRVLKIIIN